MGIEQGSEEKFMHKPGEFFIASDEKVHVLARVTSDEDPAGIESEEYTAVCGGQSQSWGMPSQGIKFAEFGDLSKLIRLTDDKCPECFEQITWLKIFQTICEEMKKTGEKEISLPGRGRIVLSLELECPKHHSGDKFIGIDLEYGAFYECAIASYCPSCQNIFETREGVNFAPYGQEKFLPIMRKKLIENPDYRELCSPGESCPTCKGTTYKFYKDLGGIDFYDNNWTVCINPKCSWPGEHSETYEQGPY